MRTFTLNGMQWRVQFVDPNSEALIDRTKTYRLATTDPIRHTIYLSNRLFGDMLTRVLLHELGHCTMFSYGLLADIHRVIPPAQWIEAEEWVCNFIADYGRQIFSTAYEVLGDRAWFSVPRHLEKFIG